MDESIQDPQVAPEAAADNPVTDEGAPVEQGQGAEQVDYFDEKFDPNQLPPELLPAYKEMQGGLTKKFQSHAEERKAFEAEREQYQNAVQLFEALQQDPETTLQELQQLLLDGADEYADDESEYDDDNPLGELQERLDRLEAEKQAEQMTQRAVATMSADVDAINELRQQANEEPLSHEELEQIAQFSMPDQNGVRPLLETYKALNGFFEQRQQKYLAGKRAPAPPGAGQAGSEKFDINDRDSRIQRLKAVLDGGR